MIGYRTRPGPRSLADGGAARPLRVATVITRLEGGAGVLALRGVQALDPGLVTPTIVTGSGGRLLEEAAASGIEVLVEPSLREVIAPRSDLAALRRLEAILRQRRVDVVHTHCAKAGTVGRLAARRAGVPRIVHTFHGFPFHQFQSPARRGAYVSIERGLGRITDVALCVGGAVAAEAARRRLIAPERIRTIGVAVDGPGRVRASMSARRPEARQRARLALGLPPDAPVVGVVGRLTYQKAPEDFLAAMQALGRPDAVGVWVGGGELAERIGRQARALRGPPRHPGRRAHGRAGPAARIRRVRPAQPLRGTAHRDRRGHDLRCPGRRDRRQRRTRSRGPGRDRPAGPAGSARPDGRRHPVPARLAGGGPARWPPRPGPAWATSTARPACGPRSRPPTRPRPGRRAAGRHLLALVGTRRTRLPNTQGD